MPAIECSGAIVDVCKNIHQPKECAYEQFPDPIKAWKIAGLPRPTAEVFVLIRHQL